MTIKDWPSDRRPREKLLAHGAPSLSDAELLAVLIRTGLKGQTALDLSHELFIRFGTWSRLMNADRDTFCKIPGLGIAKFVELHAVKEMARRCAYAALKESNVLNDSNATHRYLAAQMKDYRREVFACLFLDSANRLITFQELFYGTINVTSIHMREVIKAALDCDAVSVIAVHNHPSGSTQPSEADIQVTHHLQRALALVDISLLDHVIVARGGQTNSLATHGFL